MDAPFLSKRDLEEELRQIHQQPHRASTTALYGRSDVERVLVRMKDGAAEREEVFLVRQVQCELALRQALLHDDERQVLLLDFAPARLPPDIEARLAGRKLFYVAEDRRLGRKFNVHGAGLELMRSRALCRALLDEPEAIQWQAPGPTVGLDLGWRALLETQAHLPRQTALSLELLTVFCARGTEWAAFSKYIEQRPELRESLYRYLAQSAGEVAAIAWRAWERGDGRRVAALALILEVGAERMGGDGYLRGSLTQILERIAPGRSKQLLNHRELLQRWGEIARPLKLRLEPREFAAVLAEAEALLPDTDAAEGLAGSAYLRQAFAYNKRQLAQALLDLVARPTREGFTAACGALSRLRRYHLKDEEPHKTLLERAWMAVRLGGYLVLRPDITARAKDGTPYEEMVQLAQHHAAEGGFVDWARRVARGRSESDEALEEAVGQMVAAVDERRDQDDHRFSRGLKAWLGAQRPDERVVPIDRVLEKVAARFLKDQPHRRLLVLLLDGMAWGHAVELMLSMEERQWQYAPIRWRPVRGGQAQLPPVLAALPTVTEVSRSALFGGKLLRQGEVPAAAKDPERFAAHAALHRATGEVPELLLRADVETPSGDARKEALDLVSSQKRVVGIVINAIDDQLHGSRQVRLRYDLDTIKLLPDLLQRAAEAQRAVLLVSDHGHVPGARMRYLSRQGAGGGARWRELGPDEDALPTEVAFEEEQVWRPRGRARIALLCQETERYGTSIGEGEHGGATLAEVVAPAILLAAEDLAERVGGDDPELEVVPFPRPPWWDLDLDEVRQPAPPAPAEPPRRPAAKAPAATAQLPLLIPPPPAEPTGGAASAEVSRWGKLLLESPIFKDLPTEKKRVLREEIVPRVELLAGHDGRMAPEVFATRAGILPVRVGGLVSTLGEWLNLDGYQVVQLDRALGQVVLKLDLLKNLFGEG